MFILNKSINVQANSVSPLFYCKHKIGVKKSFLNYHETKCGMLSVHLRKDSTIRLKKKDHMNVIMCNKKTKWTILTRNPHFRF